MFSKSMLAAGLFAIANIAVASPIEANATQENAIQGNPLHERGAIKEQDAPTYCQIFGNERANTAFVYIDLSQDCQDAGLSNKCCLSIDTQGPHHPWSENDRSDLMNVIAKQSKKDGTFSSSKVGVWTAGYEILSSNDLVDSQLLQVWFHTIQDINLDATSGLGHVYLQIVQGTDDITNYMRINRHW